MKMESTDVVGGRCMRGNDGTLYPNDKERAKLWKADFLKNMNEGNEWNKIEESNTVQGLIERVLRE